MTRPSNSIKKLLLKLELKTPKSLNLLLSPEHNSDSIKNIQSYILKTIKTIDDAIIYCKNNNNYNLLQPLQNLERKSSNLIDIYKNLYPIITKNNQLKNFFLEKKHSIY